MTREQAILGVAFAIPILLGAIACISDLRQRRIPNWIAVVLALSGVSFHAFLGGGHGFLWSLGGLAVGFGILLIVHLVGGAGAGDVKFMGGVGAWIGPFHVFMVYILSVILIALFAVLVLLGRLIHPVRPVDPALGRNAIAPASVGDSKSSRIVVPYAVPAVLAILVRLGWLLLIKRTLY